MTSGDSMRASDQDREKVIEALQQQVGTGRLTLAEFEERSAQANAAKTIGDLRKLIEDLPVDIFGRPTQQIPGWPTATPMPPRPPWANQGGGHPWSGNRSPMRQFPSTVLLGGVAVGVLAIVALSALFAVGRLAIPILPLIFVLLLIGRRGGRRYRR